METASGRARFAPAAFAPAGLTVLATIGRSEIPAEERLDTMASADALRAAGKRAVACASVDEAIREAAAAAHPGDTIVVMSNGRFEDAPDRILLALMGTGSHPNNKVNSAS